MAQSAGNDWKKKLQEEEKQKDEKWEESGKKTADKLIKSNPTQLVITGCGQAYANMMIRLLNEKGYRAIQFASDWDSGEDMQIIAILFEKEKWRGKG